MTKRPLAPRVLILLCLWTLCDRSIGTILVYHREDGQISTKPVYGINSNHRAIIGREFQDHDLIYLITADPSDWCLANLRRPPEHFVDGLPAKFVLLMNDERCGEGFYVKLQNARQKGYDGVIVYPAWIHNKGTLALLADIPDHIANNIEFNVDFIGYDEGVELKKYDSRSFPSTRYLLRFTELMYEAEKSEESTASTIRLSRSSNTEASDRCKGFSCSSTSLSEPWFKNQLVMLVFVCPLMLVLVLSPLICEYRGTPRRARTTTTPVFTSGRYPVATEPRANVLEVGDQFFPVATAPSANVLELGNRFYPVDEVEAADRDEIVRRFIDNLLAQAQVQQHEEHLRITGQPLTLEEVDQLAALSVTRVTEDNCPMCQENFALGEVIIIPYCNHACHKTCLIPWLTEYSRRCPVCRQTIEPD